MHEMDNFQLFNVLSYAFKCLIKEKLSFASKLLVLDFIDLQICQQFFTMSDSQDQIIQYAHTIRNKEQIVTLTEEEDAKLYKCSQEQFPLVKLQDAQPVVAHDVKDMGASGHIQGICSKCSSANRQILLFSDLQDSYL